MAKGWECTGCGRNYAPHVDECAKCNAEPRKPVPMPSSQPSPRPSTRRERVPGADLHEMLYTPSINEFEDGSWKKPGDDDDSGKGGVF